MDRTKKLLLSVTASALLTGSAGSNARLLEVKAATTNSERMEPDPQSESQALILRLLDNVEQETAMSIDEILEKEPSLSRNTAEPVLKKLVARGKIKRIGDARNQPYRYYNPRAADNRKLDEASTVISGLLRGVEEEDAMSLNELLAKRPSLDRGLAQRAIQYLKSQGRIKVTGDNTKNKPFRYYDRSRGGHGM